MAVSDSICCVQICVSQTLEDFFETFVGCGLMWVKTSRGAEQLKPDIAVVVVVRSLVVHFEYDW